MCGIVGYVGRRKAAPVLLDCLKRLEYRGYDSAGLVTLEGGFHLKKDSGKIAEIDAKLNFSEMPGSCGLGHTRWATHGRPSARNAHPHLDSSKRIAVVHNGIIENYLELKRELQKHGFRFISETDTEVIPNLISFYLSQGKGLEGALRKTVERLEGSFALGILDQESPSKLIAIRKESPLIIGIGKGEMFLASDIPALLHHTKRVLVMRDGEVAILTPEDFSLRKVDTWQPLRRRITRIPWTAEMAEKGGFPYFTLKEIYEQPIAIRETLRTNPQDISTLAEFILKSKRLYLVACGTSYHAALVGKYALAKLADFPAEAIISSEFQESCRVSPGTALLAITQSGETADTLKAVRVAKAAGARIACLTNVIGSSITRESSLVRYIYAGPEISVVATKTFAAQVAFLLLLAIQIAREKGLLGETTAKKLGSELRSLPEALRAILPKVDEKMRALAKKYRDAEHIYLIGRGIGYPTVLEGALKLKEITYVHSEALPAGELKHGTLALIERGIPVLAAVPPGDARGRMIGNIEEIRARGATLVAIAEQGDDEVRKHVDNVLHLPPVNELFSPLLYILPLQLLAYHIAVERGHDPDKPRHLAKSVTVE
jgi:glucosamine--fructose-6-phosphate aminotransferase (isomerizing)